jgi:hypothetical protein
VDDLAHRLAEGLGAQVVRLTALGGGCVGDVRRATLRDGRDVVVKQGAGLALEARMLRFLKDNTAVPVPAVLWEADGLLAMEYIPAGGPMSETAAEDAAEKIAALHTVSASRFGLGGTRSSAACTSPIPKPRHGVNSSATTVCFTWGVKP